MRKFTLLLCSAALILAACNAPKATDEATASPADKVLVRDFFPTVMNNIPVTEVKRGKFPIIDMHSHDYVESAEQIAEWVKVMDAVGGGLIPSMITGVVAITIIFLLAPLVIIITIFVITFIFFYFIIFFFSICFLCINFVIFFK